MSCYIHVYRYVEVNVLPREPLGTMRTHVWFLYPSLMWPDMITHAILSLKPLLTDRTGVRLLIGMGQSMPVQMVHVPERLSTSLTSMVLPYWIGVWVGIRSCVYWQRICYGDRYLDRGGIIEVVVCVAIWCSLKKKEKFQDLWPGPIYLVCVYGALNKWFCSMHIIFEESDRFFFSE